MNLKFPKALRLKTKEQLQQAFQNTSKISARNFAIFSKPNKLYYPRLGIIITKRAVRSAVNRNRLKRIIRESFRLQQKNIAGKDIIFLAYKGLDKIAREELKECLTKKWQQLSH